MSDEDPRREDSPPGEADGDGQAEAAGAGETAEEASPSESASVDSYEQRARLAEARLDGVLEAYRKLKGENEAHRERVARNIERRFAERRERLLLKFIEILDNLDRALEASERSLAAEPFIEGLILVRTHLLQTLHEQGLERVPALGLSFDPSYGEAVETCDVDDPDHDQVVVKELQRGYRIDGKVVRVARVVVGQYKGA